MCRGRGGGRLIVPAGLQPAGRYAQDAREVDDIGRGERLGALDHADQVPVVESGVAGDLA